MSRQLVNEYFNEISTLRKMSGTSTEGVISEAFKDLLKSWSRQKNLVFIAQYEFLSPQKNRIRPDGTILHDLRVPLGYWEAKDEADDLDVEIAKKLKKGYPQDNIIFEDSREAVLIQNRSEVMRAAMTDGDELLRLLKLFFEYERQEIAEFRKAVQQFKADLPAVLQALREKIDTAYSENNSFKTAADTFLQHARDTINPTLGEADVREMLIQHILTEEIFANVFNDSDFHRENNIARELYALEGAFFTGSVKRDTLAAVQTYYATIRSTAALITKHSEKQTFLKVIYENFYKVYDSKKADRLGVVYTPNEIVKFMIDGADWLCQKHFGKALIDEGVEILDPATGTGTFICELLEHFRGQPEKLKRKYKEELHANEVAILPYYVANLNIEATYAAITGQYAEFPNLCFVDTLDNIGGLGIKRGHQHDMFAALSDENIERVKRQNRRKISVIIGNPPYNAWQDNYNKRNANRPYARIDQRIADTYIKEGTAQNKNSVYDMYTRFIRWASDRVSDEGIVAFIIGRKPFAKTAYNGFRKVIAREFSEIWVFDLGGDVRDNPKLSGTKHNVFGIQTGVAMVFLVKRKIKSGSAMIRYARRPETESAEDKLAAISAIVGPRNLQMETIQPDAMNDWLGQTNNDWTNLLPLVSVGGNGLFEIASNGIETKRDEWVYGRDRLTTIQKASVLVDTYEAVREGFAAPSAVKWDRESERRIRQGEKSTFSETRLQEVNYRPFSKRFLYVDPNLVAYQFKAPEMFWSGHENAAVAFSDPGYRAGYCVLASNRAIDRHFGAAVDGYRYVARYKFIGHDRIDNLTSWGLKQFQRAYGVNGLLDPSRLAALAPQDEGAAVIPQSGLRSPPRRGRKETNTRPIILDDIFHYVYAVLHDPLYREKYALNLKRDFPRIPFYTDFWQWVAWGETLMALHIAYETVEPWPLKRVDATDERAKATGVSPKAMLKADKENGSIRLDSETLLSGVPAEVWAYKLGNRSGVEWILDQYKEKTPKDPTIREKFNTYRFADYKEKVVDLISRVTRVSVETVAITEAMKLAKR